MKQCSECGGAVSTRAKTCPHCGYTPSYHAECVDCTHNNCGSECDDSDVGPCPAYEYYDDPS